MEKDARTDKMVQTKAGSQNNPWLEHLRHCAAEYHKRRAVEHASSAEEHRDAAATGTPAEDKPIRRRMVGKRPEAKAATAPPKAKVKPLTEKDNKKITKTVKDQGKQAKKKAAEAAKGGKQK